jgi:hypothetical protein
MNSTLSEFLARRGQVVTRITGDGDIHCVDDEKRSTSRVRTVIKQTTSKIDKAFCLELKSQSWSLCKRLVLISTQKPSRYCKTLDKKVIEIIHERDIQIAPITVCTKLTESEIVDFEKRRQCPRAKLPKMLLSDPVAIYYGFHAGDVVGISNVDFRFVVA